MKVIYVLHGSDNDGIIAAYDRKAEALSNAKAYCGPITRIEDDMGAWQINLYGDRRNASLHLVPVDLDIELNYLHQ